MRSREEYYDPVQMDLDAMEEIETMEYEIRFQVRREPIQRRIVHCTTEQEARESAAQTMPEDGRLVSVTEVGS